MSPSPPLLLPPTMDTKSGNSELPIPVGLSPAALGSILPLSMLYRPIHVVAAERDTGT